MNAKAGNYIDFLLKDSWQYQSFRSVDNKKNQITYPRSLTTFFGTKKLKLNLKDGKLSLKYFTHFNTESIEHKKLSFSPAS